MTLFLEPNHEPFQVGYSVLKHGLGVIRFGEYCLQGIYGALRLDD